MDSQMLEIMMACLEYVPLTGEMLISCGCVEFLQSVGDMTPPLPIPKPTQ